MKEIQGEDKSKKKSVSAIANELEGKLFTASETEDKKIDKSLVSSRTLIRNFNLLLATLNQEENRFKDSKGFYTVNEGTEPLLEVMLLESNTKGSYFYYAKNNRAEEASNEEIISTYNRIHNHICDVVDEDRLKLFLKVVDKAVGYSFAIEQQKIQEELADFISTIESLQYAKKVKELRKIRKQFLQLSEEAKKNIKKALQEEKTETPKI